MKKLLLITLLTFTTFANADDYWDDKDAGRYTMLPGTFFNGEGSGIWILDSKNGSRSYCWKPQYGIRIQCDNRLPDYISSNE